MPPQAIAEADITAPAVLAIKRGEGQLSAAAALTGDLIRRAKSSVDPGRDMKRVRPEPAPAEAPAPSAARAPSVAPRPRVATAPSVVPAAAVVLPTAMPPAPAVDLVAMRDETPSAARALRRDMNAARRSGGVARSVGLFVVIYAVACVLMIYALA